MKHPAKIGLLLGLAAVIGVAGFWFNRAAGPEKRPAEKTTPGNAALSTPAPAAQPIRAVQPSVQSLQPPPLAETLSDAIRLIVRPDGKAGFSERVAAVHAIKEALNSEEIRAFYGYLLAPAHNQDQDDRVQENWLRNEMLDKLVRQPTLPAGLPDVLVAIYQDQDQDVVMRDYAVQHMTPAYAQAGADEKASLQQALWQAAQETDSSIAGTALLSLNDLAQSSAEFDQNQIAQTALKLAGDDQCGELARITAIQICGRMGVTQALSVALQLAQQAGSVPLRITAIAALGDLGDQNVETFLQQIAAGDEDRLKPAAVSALKRLNKRLGT
jgi:hypothetical protein